MPRIKGRIPCHQRVDPMQVVTQQGFIEAQSGEVCVGQAGDLADQRRQRFPRILAHGERTMDFTRPALRVDDQFHDRQLDQASIVVQPGGFRVDNAQHRLRAVLGWREPEFLRTWQASEDAIVARRCFERTRMGFEGAVAPESERLHSNLHEGGPAAAGPKGVQAASRMRSARSPAIMSPSCWR